MADSVGPLFEKCIKDHSALGFDFAAAAKFAGVSEQYEERKRMEASIEDWDRLFRSIRDVAPKPIQLAMRVFDGSSRKTIADATEQAMLLTLNLLRCPHEDWRTCRCEFATAAGEHLARVQKSHKRLLKRLAKLLGTKPEPWAVSLRSHLDLFVGVCRRFAKMPADANPWADPQVLSNLTACRRLAKDLGEALHREWVLRLTAWTD